MSNVLIIPRVVEINADESAFLYQQRLLAQKSSQYNLKELAEIDNRLLSHLEGLVIGSEISWEYVEENLDFEEPGEVFTAAYLAISIKDNDKLEKTFEVAGNDDALLQAIADAFIWQENQLTPKLAEGLYKTQKPEKMCVALRIYTSIASVPEEIVADALNSTDPNVFRQGVDLICSLGFNQFLPVFISALDNEDEDISFAVAWCATRFGKQEGMNKLKEFVAHPKYAESALMLVTMQKDINNTFELIKQLFSDDSTMRLALIGLGYLGNTTYMNDIISCMKIDNLARVAGEAFSNITGIDLVENGLEKTEPTDIVTEESESPEDENVELDQDDDLPWPDAEKIERWWSIPENQTHYAGAERHLVGHPLSKSLLQRVLLTGNQKQRVFATNCLGVYERNDPVFNVFSPVRKQNKILNGV